MANWRLAVGDYYERRPVLHTAQGDIFSNVPFVWAGPVTTLHLDRHADPAAYRVHEDVLMAPAVVCNATQSFVKKEGGYLHKWRLMAPVLSFRLLGWLGLGPDRLHRLQRDGYSGGYVYVPDPQRHAGPERRTKGAFAGHAAISLGRLSCVHEDLLGARDRLARLTLPAQRILAAHLMGVVTPNRPDPQDSALLDPETGDQWPPGYVTVATTSPEQSMYDDPEDLREAAKEQAEAAKRSRARADKQVGLALQLLERSGASPDDLREAARELAEAAKRSRAGADEQVGLALRLLERSGASQDLISSTLQIPQDRVSALLK